MLEASNNPWLSRFLAMATAIDSVCRETGQRVAWLTVMMVCVTAVVVVLRYFFNTGWIWLQELITWMHAMVFLLGAAYTLQADEHVRVDVFYRRMSARGQATVDIAGTLLLLLPTCGFILWSSWDYVLGAWKIAEGSREAGGLPYPFTPLLKSAILVMAVLLVLQGLALLVRSVARIVRPSEPSAPRPGSLV